jgi:hypothetical protein
MRVLLLLLLVVLLVLFGCRGFALKGIQHTHGLD